MISTEFDFIEECVQGTCDLAADHGFVLNSWLRIVVLLDFISHEKSVSHRRIMQWWNEKKLKNNAKTNSANRSTFRRNLVWIEFKVAANSSKQTNTVTLNMIEMVIVLLQAYSPTWLRPAGLALGVKWVKVLTVVLKTYWPRGDYNIIVLSLYINKQYKADFKWFLK